MIKDRCPYVVNLAFKWCTEFGRLSNIGKEPHKRIKYAVKTRWIDRVYQENVAIYNTGRGIPRTDEKNASLRKALGIHEGSQNFNFADSINLDGINKVLEERKLELAFEGQRWFDLKRTGKAIEIIKNRKDASGNPLSYAANITEQKLLWPIPQSQIDNNPNLTQNAGY